MYLAIAISCPDCGTQGFQLFREKPSQEDLNKLKEAIGGMRCIEAGCKEIEPDGETVTTSLSGPLV